MVLLFINGAAAGTVHSAYLRVNSMSQSQVVDKNINTSSRGISIFFTHDWTNVKNLRIRVDPLF